MFAITVFAIFKVNAISPLLVKFIQSGAGEGHFCLRKKRLFGDALS